MKIGFDLDGVLATTNISVYRMADLTNHSEEIYMWNYRMAKPLLNPMDFMLFKEDEYIIITSRIESGRQITEEWVEKYCPHCSKLFILDNGFPKDDSQKEVYKWLDRMVKSKADVINETKLDVYLEDSAYIVKKLRKLCPNCKIIHFGGRV